MKYDKYPLRPSESFLQYEFYSDGPKGRITKRVLFNQYTDSPEVYELILGDLEANGEVNVFVVTDNGDRDKVLATVAWAIERFFEFYPDKSVFFTGSTAVRTRLYRMAIVKHLDELQTNFHLFGLINEKWQIFEKGPASNAFILRKKLNTFVGT